MVVFAVRASFVVENQKKLIGCVASAGIPRRRASGQEEKTF